MNISERGLNLIKSFESCRLTSYLPTPNDVWTIGWGHTQGVTKDMIWTQQEADKALLQDVAEAERAVRSGVRVPLTQPEFDAMVSLVFNVGPGRRGGKDGIITLKTGEPSTLLRKLNAYDYDGASEQFLRWNKQAGQVLNGLTRRREEERALFEATV